jgi:hypothetical protein
MILSIAITMPSFAKVPFEMVPASLQDHGFKIVRNWRIEHQGRRIAHVGHGDHARTRLHARNDNLDCETSIAVDISAAIRIAYDHPTITAANAEGASSNLLAHGVTDRQPLQAADDVRLDPGGLAGEIRTVEPQQQFAIQRLHLHPRQM